MRRMEPIIKLSEEAINEFKLIYREECGRALSDDEAQEMALRLLHLFQILSRPPCS